MAYDRETDDAATSEHFPTITAGELIKFLSQFDPDKPVTIDVQGCDELERDWLNLDGGYLANAGAEDEGPSITLVARDDFHIFQF